MAASLHLNATTKLAKRIHRRIDRDIFRPGVKRLEDRVTPATFYVDDYYRITTNVAPTYLSPGDIVTWDFGQADQVAGLTYGTNAFLKVRDAAAAAASGDTILVAAGHYTELGPTVISGGKSLTIIGAGVSRTVLYAGFNTSSSGDARAWFQVLSGSSLNMSQLTMTGYYHWISEGIRYSTGAVGGTVQSVGFQYIRPPWSTYDGIGVEVMSGNVDVLSCGFYVMGRMGAQYLNAGTTGHFLGNTYTGKGWGNWVDYGVEIGDGASVLVSGNRIQNCRGLAYSGLESAGILVNTLLAPGTSATILSNQVSNNLNGIVVGSHKGDNDSSTVVANSNNITGNYYFGMVVTSKSAMVDATNNWWGSPLGPHSHSNPGGWGNAVTDYVDFEPFLTHVAAVLPVATVDEYLSNTSGFIVVGGGGDTGSPTIKVLRPDGSLVYSVDAFADSNGQYLNYPLSVAVGDVTGDGIPDVVAAEGPGGLAQVRVLDGVTHAIVRRFTAPYYSTGASVAIGDINADGVGDIIIGSGPNVTPWVAVYSGKTGGLLRGFQAFKNWLNRGGVNVAAGDFNHDGFDDIVIGQGEGNYSDVRVVSGSSIYTELLSFRAYDSSFLGGVHVATGDFNGDGTPDILTAGGEGPPQVVKAFSGASLTSLFTLDPGYPAGFLGGVRVAANDLSGDGVPDIVTGPGPGFEPLVKLFNGTDRSEITSFLAFDSSLLGGISVGAV